MEPSKEGIEAVSKSIIGFTRNFIPFDGTVTFSQVAGSSTFDFTYHQDATKHDGNAAVVRLYNMMTERTDDESFPLMLKEGPLKAVNIEGNPDEPSDLKLKFSVGKSDYFDYKGYSESKIINAIMEDTETRFLNASDFIKAEQAADSMNAKIGRLLNQKIPPERILSVLDRVTTEWFAVFSQSEQVPDRPFITASEVIDDAKKPTVKELLAGFEAELNGTVSSLARCLYLPSHAAEAILEVNNNLKGAIKRSKGGGPSVAAQWAAETGQGRGIL